MCKSCYIYPPEAKPMGFAQWKFALPSFFFFDLYSKRAAHLPLLSILSARRIRLSLSRSLWPQSATYSDQVEARQVTRSRPHTKPTQATRRPLENHPVFNGYVAFSEICDEMVDSLRETFPSVCAGVSGNLPGPMGPSLRS